MIYKILISKQANKFLAGIPKKDQEKITEKIHELATNPSGEGVIKLVNVSPDTYRARQGDYRIMFHIHDSELVVDVIDIAHRSAAYR